jgi:NADH-quinone oxidoreductase subunit G
MLELHKSQDNPYVTELYSTFLGEVGSPKAHELLHTSYKSRKRIADAGMAFSSSEGDQNVEVNVCFGTGCFLKGAQGLLREILEYINANGLEDRVNVGASFCFETCDKGPVIRVGETTIEACTPEKAAQAIRRETALLNRSAAGNV